MLPEFQLWLAMTEISVRNCLDDEWPLLISEVSRASPKKKNQRGKTDDSAPTERSKCLRFFIYLDSFFFVKDTFCGARIVQSATLLCLQ